MENLNKGGIRDQINQNKDYGLLTVDKIIEIVNTLFTPEERSKIDKDLSDIRTAVNKTDDEIKKIVDKEVEEIFNNTDAVRIINGKFSMLTGREGYREYKLLLYKTLRDTYSNKDFLTRINEYNKSYNEFMEKVTNLKTNNNGNSK
jgi:hypothetical protein